MQQSDRSTFLSCPVWRPLCVSDGAESWSQSAALLLLGSFTSRGADEADGPLNAATFVHVGGGLIKETVHPKLQSQDQAVTEVQVTFLHLR